MVNYDHKTFIVQAAGPKSDNFWAESGRKEFVWANKNASENAPYY